MSLFNTGIYAKWCFIYIKGIQWNGTHLNVVFLICKTISRLTLTKRCNYLHVSSYLQMISKIYRVINVTDHFDVGSSEIRITFHCITYYDNDISTFLTDYLPTTVLLFSKIYHHFIEEARKNGNETLMNTFVKIKRYIWHSLVRCGSDCYLASLVSLKTFYISIIWIQ